MSSAGYHHTFVRSEKGSESVTAVDPPGRCMKPAKAEKKKREKERERELPPPPHPKKNAVFCQKLQIMRGRREEIKKPSRYHTPRLAVRD
jgi:hypothetical protein